MKLAVMTLAALALLAGPAFAGGPQALLFGMASTGKPAIAQDASKVESESQSIFTTIIKIVIKWIFPVCAAYCFLYGIIGKGVKRGEWDMATICTLAAIGLALFPKLLTALFGVTL